MIVNTIVVDGVDRIVWDSDRGVITYSSDGVTEMNVRAFTEAEQHYVQQFIFETQETNVDLLKAEAAAAVATMLAGVAQLKKFAAGTLVSDAAINANPAQYMRLVVDEVVEVEQNLIAVARLVGGMTESTNTGN